MVENNTFCWSQVVRELPPILTSHFGTSEAFESVHPRTVDWLSLKFGSGHFVHHYRVDSSNRTFGGCLPSVTVFWQRLSLFNSFLTSKAISIKRWCLLSEAVFHQMLSSNKVCLPSNALFHQRLFIINSRLYSIYDRL